MVAEAKRREGSSENHFSSLAQKIRLIDRQADSDQQREDAEEQLLKAFRFEKITQRDSTTAKRKDNRQRDKENVERSKRHQILTLLRWSEYASQVRKKSAMAKIHVTAINL